MNFYTHENVKKPVTLLKMKIMKHPTATPCYTSWYDTRLHDIFYLDSLLNLCLKAYKIFFFFYGLHKKAEISYTIRLF